MQWSVSSKTCQAKSYYLIRGSLNQNCDGACGLRKCQYPDQQRRVWVWVEIKNQHLPDHWAMTRPTHESATELSARDSPPTPGWTNGTNNWKWARKLAGVITYLSLPMIGLGERFSSEWSSEWCWFDGLCWRAVSLYEETDNSFWGALWERQWTWLLLYPLSFLTQNNRLANTRHRSNVACLAVIFTLAGFFSLCDVLFPASLFERALSEE